MAMLLFHDLASHRLKRTFGASFSLKRTFGYAPVAAFPPPPPHPLSRPFHLFPPRLFALRATEEVLHLAGLSTRWLPFPRRTRSASAFLSQARWKRAPLRLPPPVVADDDDFFPCASSYSPTSPAYSPFDNQD